MPQLPHGIPERGRAPGAKGTAVQGQSAMSRAAKQTRLNTHSNSKWVAQSAHADAQQGVGDPAVLRPPACAAVHIEEHIEEHIEAWRVMLW